YKFQVQSAKYDPIIKLILRTTGGVFDFYITLNEYELAKKLRVSYDMVVRMLQGLQQLEIASYLPKTDAPQLEFLQARVDYKHLFIDTSFIAERKRIKEEQAKAIYAYLDTKDCRSVALQTYFGEEEVTFCGSCDLCLMRQHRDDIHNTLQEEIKTALLAGEKDVKTLVDELTLGDDDTKLHVIRLLRSEE